MRILKTPYGGHLTNTRTTTILHAQEAWEAVKDIAKKELSNKRLFRS